MALFYYNTDGDIFLPGITGLSGSLTNTAQSTGTIFSQGVQNAIAHMPPIGANPNGMDSSGSNLLGGQSPSTVPTSDSGIGGSGSGANTGCMTSSETNSVTGNSSVGQGSACLGVDPNANGFVGNCGYIGVANNTGLNITDTSDLTDFSYTDNADGM